MPAPYVGPSSIYYWCLFSYLAVLRLFRLRLTVADVMASALDILSISVSLITSTVTTVVWSHNLSITVSMTEAPSLKVEMAILAAASTLFPTKTLRPYDGVEALVSMLHALKQAVTWHVVVHWNKLLPTSYVKTVPVWCMVFPLYPLYLYPLPSYTNTRRELNLFT